MQLAAGLVGCLVAAPCMPMAAAPPLVAGIANTRSIDVSLAGDNLAVSVGRVKTAKQPKKAKDTQVIKQKNVRRALVGVGKQVSSFRPDLKVRGCRTRG